MLRSVAKHSPELAQAVVDSGALDALVPCLEEFDPSVKESAAWALGYIAGHTGGLCPRPRLAPGADRPDSPPPPSELAQAVVDAGAIPLLVLCIQEPEISLKRISASALSDICKHSPEVRSAPVLAPSTPATPPRRALIAPLRRDSQLAQAVVDAGAVAYLAPLIGHPDARLKRQVCSCLAQIAKHSVDLAEVVVEAEIFPKILTCLKDMDVYVRKNAATCIREVAKQTLEVSAAAHLYPHARPRLRPHLGLPSPTCGPADPTPAARSSPSSSSTPAARRRWLTSCQTARATRVCRASWRSAIFPHSPRLWRWL